LLGVGHVRVADMDHIELSNLSRSVLFREADEGKAKATCAARAARDLYPQMDIAPLEGNILAEVGLGYFRWADVVVGALDNREARVFVNSACAGSVDPGSMEESRCCTAWCGGSRPRRPLVMSAP
jgi:adenylyltransferase/sulfurtransferase